MRNLRRSRAANTSRRRVTVFRVIQRTGSVFCRRLRLDTPFGYMLAPNITPDAATGIGNWSADDFYRSMHDGVNQRGEYLYPVMPYDFYTKVTREDSDAIYAYLRTLKRCVMPLIVNHLRFPFNQRLSWRSGGSCTSPRARTRGGRGEISPAWNRGAYLVEGSAIAARVIRPTTVGRNREGKEFTGGHDGWFALNLTSDIARA